MRDNVYHPAFNGSFSLKYVLAPMTGLTYNDLVIVDGRLASVEDRADCFRGPQDPARRADRLRQDLLAYCERDTWATVMLMKRLKELAASVHGESPGAEAISHPTAPSPCPHSSDPDRISPPPSSD